jgi:hypothetical protein
MTYNVETKLSNTQRQTIYGTILGGSTIVIPKNGKNCYLSMRDRDFNWISYKVYELSSFFKKDEPLKLEGSTYRCHSFCFSVFKEIYPMFYKNKKKYINKNLLEYLNDTAWMTWFLDAGYYINNKAHIKMTYYQNKDRNLVKNYFNSLNCTCDVVKNKIIFNEKGTEMFFKTFLHRVPKFALNSKNFNC